MRTRQPTAQSKPSHNSWYILTPIQENIEKSFKLRKGTKQIYFHISRCFELSYITCTVHLEHVFVQVKLLSFFSMTDGLDDITDEECTEKLEKMKENMIKSYNYSQGMQNQN